MLRARPAPARRRRRDAAVPWWRRAHRLDPGNWTYKRQAWTLSRRPTDADANDLIQEANDVYAGNWLDDVVAGGGGATTPSPPTSDPAAGCPAADLRRRRRATRVAGDGARALAGRAVPCATRRWSRVHRVERRRRRRLHRRAHAGRAWWAPRRRRDRPRAVHRLRHRPPHVRLDDERRTIVWPTVGMWSASMPGGDVMLVLGPEPALRWRLFCEQIVGVAERFGAPMTITSAPCSPTCRTPGRCR